MAVEIVTLIVAIIVALILWKVLKTIKNMVINTVLGLVVLVVANMVLGLNIAYTWVVILVCAIAGIVGALLIIVLNYFGVAF